MIRLSSEWTGPGYQTSDASQIRIILRRYGTRDPASSPREKAYALIRQRLPVVNLIPLRLCCVELLVQAKGTAVCDSLPHLPL